ncbi:DNA strand-pairing protein [Lithospermum erythrorhizon]|uniref:DNA strand-pairing protein n=1 Tax=Lithospermum erythrorhizon TaxID=34254 RepID=A0AAV3PC07_LITER
MVAPSRLAPQFMFHFKLQTGICCLRRHISYTSSAVDSADIEFSDEVHDNGKTKEKETALHAALSQISGGFGKESMLSLQRFFRTRRAPVVSTGSLNIDQALGIGGLPKGRMVEIYGQEASGKTTLALHIINEAQKLGGYCAYLDAENAMNPSLAETIGVDMNNLLISQPNSAENLLSIVDTLTKSGALSVIVVDSVAALVPQLELDSCIDASSEDIRSKMMTQALRKINYSLCNSNTLLVFINQVRASNRSPFNSRDSDLVTSGGNALRFYSAVRLRLIRKRLLKNMDKATGLRICVQVVKNKLAPAMAEAELSIKFGSGFCRESEVLELGCEHGVIVKDGGCYYIEGVSLNSEMEAENYLAANHRVLDKIVNSLRDQMFERRKN